MTDSPVVLTDERLDQLRFQFPYLRFEREVQRIETDFASIGDHYLRYGPDRPGQDGMTSSHTTHARHGHFSHAEPQMRIANVEGAIDAKIRARHPALWVSAHIHKDGISLGIWVARDGRDHEAIDGNLDFGSAGSEEKLARYGEEAARALADGWFFCTGHGRAEQVAEGRWGHFAGSYCAEWGVEHPESRSAAAREDYR